MYRLLLVLHGLAFRFGFSEEFLQVSDRLHRKFGLPALQPVRIRR